MSLQIALTGSIGMGKSAVAAMFARAGIPVFDADVEVRRLQGKGGALVDAIEARFPGSVSDGIVDRDALSAMVLGKPDALTALEAIVHPAVEESREQFIAAHRDVPALIFEVPLLYETGGQFAFDKVIVVSAPADVQRARVLARSGMSDAKLDAILARQVPDAEKRTQADFVIDTGGDMSTTEAQVAAIMACLGLAAGR